MQIETIDRNNSFAAPNENVLNGFFISPELTKKTLDTGNYFKGEYKYLHNFICNTFRMYEKNENANLELEAIKTEINKCVPLKIYGKYEYSNLLAKKRIFNSRKKCDILFEQLKKLNKCDLEYLRQESEDFTSVFLVLVGVRPAYVINNKMAAILHKINDKIYENFRCIDTDNDNSRLVNDPNYTLFMNIDEVKRVFNCNQDVFPHVNNMDEIINFITKNPILFRARYCKDHSDRINKYYGHLCGGLILGFPKSEAIKFAAYDEYLKEYYSKVKNIYLDVEEYRQAMGNKDKYHEILKNKRIESMKNHNQKIIKRMKEENDQNLESTAFTVGLIPEEAIDILAEVNTEYIPGTFYLKFGNDKANENLRKAAETILKYTNFDNKLRALGQN